MKTIEQEASNFAHKKINSIPENHIQTLPKFFVMAASRDGFKSGVDFATKWIPIEEELPPLHEDVLLKCESSFVDKGCLIHQSGDNMFSSSSGDLDIVTHWRPISFL